MESKVDTLENEFCKKGASESDKFNSQLAALEKEVDILDAKADRINTRKSHLLFDGVETNKKKPVVKEMVHAKPKVIVTKKKPEEKKLTASKSKSLTSKKQNQVKTKKVKKIKKGI
jgi:hypothetical protein